jgi:hypothetical protein
LFATDPLPRNCQPASGPNQRDRSAATVTYDSAIVQMLSSANAYP